MISSHWLDSFLFDPKSQAFPTSKNGILYLSNNDIFWTFVIYVFFSMISSSEKSQTNASMNKHNLTGENLKLTDELDFGRCQMSVFWTHNIMVFSIVGSQRIQWNESRKTTIKNMDYLWSLLNVDSPVWHNGANTFLKII